MLHCCYRHIFITLLLVTQHNYCMMFIYMEHTNQSSKHVTTKKAAPFCIVNLFSALVL